MDQFYFHILKKFLLKGMACHIVKPGSEKIAAIEKVVYEYFDT